MHFLLKQSFVRAVLKMKINVLQGIYYQQNGSVLPLQENPFHLDGKNNNNKRLSSGLQQNPEDVLLAFFVAFELMCHDRNNSPLYLNLFSYKPFFSFQIFGCCRKFLPKKSMKEILRKPLIVKS